MLTQEESGKTGKAATPRWPSMSALAVPVLAGLGFMAAYGAPSHYLAINAIALAAGLVLSCLPYGEISEIKLRLVSGALLLLFALPLVTGPELNGIARWIPIGPFTLHAGMATIPALVVVAAQRDDCSPMLLLAASLIALLQPDAGSSFAISFSCITLAAATNRWQPGLVAAIAFTAALIAFTRGVLPHEDFVERVLVDAFGFGIIPSTALAAAMLAALVLMMCMPRTSSATRFGLTGSLAGLTFISITSDYPTPLIGFGAAPILGYGLALGLARNLKAQPR